MLLRSPIDLFNRRQLLEEWNKKFKILLLKNNFYNIEDKNKTLLAKGSKMNFK